MHPTKLYLHISTDEEAGAHKLTNTDCLLTQAKGIGSQGLAGPTKSNYDHGTDGRVSHGKLQGPAKGFAAKEARNPTPVRMSLSNHSHVVTALLHSAVETQSQATIAKNNSVSYDADDGSPKIFHTAFPEDPLFFHHRFCSPDGEKISQFIGSSVEAGQRPSNVYRIRYTFGFWGVWLFPHPI